MLKTGTLRRLIAAVMTALLLSGCGAGTVPAGESAGAAEGSAETAAEAQENTTEVEEGLLRIAVDESIATMDVHLTDFFYMVPLNIYERLFEMRSNSDGTSEIVPGLAKEYSVSDDGRTYSFTLRDDAFFSDGTPVKASDVEYTFTRMLSLKGSMQTDFADAILGAGAVLAHETDRLEGIEVLDDRHLTITLTEPFEGYISQLATPSCSIYSEKNVEAAGAEFGTVAEKTIGSGPYMVTEFNEDRVCLELNPYYKGEQPSVRKAEILTMVPAIMDNTFRAGGLDLLDLNYISSEDALQDYRGEEWKEEIVSRTSVNVRFLMLNVNARPLNDVRVRRALLMAVNRQKIIDELFNGEGVLLDGLFPKGLTGYTEENQGWLKYDPEGARELLEAADVDNHFRVELAVDSTSSARDLMMLSMIRRDLAAAGFNVSMISYDSESRDYLKLSGNLMAYTGEWWADFNDPDNIIYTFFGSREKTKIRSGNFSGEEVMKRIAAARRIQDHEKRMKEYAALEKKLVQTEAVWLPLMSTDHYFVKGARVESFIPHWAGWNDISFKDVILK